MSDVAVDPVVDKVEEPQTGKTFTQEEVNGLVSKESKKAIEKALKDLGVEDFKTAKEGLSKFKEMQDSQKTEAQKLQEQLEAVNGTVKEKDSLLEQTNTKLSLLTAGIPADKLEKYSKLIAITDGETLEDKIKQALEDFPLQAPATGIKIGEQTQDNGKANTFESKLQEMRKIAGLTK